jgi:hypothetical protein
MLSRIAPGDFVRQLRDAHPDLRVKWAKHTGKWFIELKCLEHDPAWLAEQPRHVGKIARKKDLWLSWHEGYLHVLTVPEDLLQWDIVAPILERLRTDTFAKAKALADRLDAQFEAEDRASDRLVENLNEVGASELYNSLSWAQKRRVSMASPPPIEPHDGFRVVDRRGSGES